VIASQYRRDRPSLGREFQIELVQLETSEETCSPDSHELDLKGFAALGGRLLLWALRSLRLDDAFAQA